MFPPSSCACACACVPVLLNDLFVLDTLWVSVAVVCYDVFCAVRVVGRMSEQSFGAGYRVVLSEPLGETDQTERFRYELRG